MEQKGEPRRPGVALGLFLCAVAAAVPVCRLEAQLPMKPERKIEVQAGRWQDVYLRLGVDSRPDLVFDVRLKQPEDPQLVLGIWEESAGRLVSRSTLRHTPGGRTLWLRVKAGRGAARQDHHAVVLVTAAEDPVTGGAVRRAAVPLRFVVRPSVSGVGLHPGRWLAALGVAVLVYFACTSVAHSRFLTLDRLAERLQPLRWNEKRETEVYKDSQESVKRQLEVSLRWRDRALNWLRANPFVFGLPGRSYEETVEIFLGRRLENLSVRPIPQHDARRRLERYPDLQANHLFASALAGNQVKLFGRPDAAGRLGSLSQKEESRKDRFDTLDAVELRDSPPRTDGPAGWKISPQGAAARRRRVWARLQWERGR